MSNWLLAPSTEPAANLARHILDLQPPKLPVPIERLISEVADIQEENWPYDCDALVAGLLSDSRPTVFLKRGLNTRRRRFTLAHEFGHVSMAWHIGEIGCKPETEVDAFSVEAVQPANRPEEVMARRRVAEQEAEATRFAAYLLMPDEILRPILGNEDMGLLLKEANSLAVSGTAFMMRLRDILQPGFCFHLSGPSGEKLFSSSGTSLPSGIHRAGHIDTEILMRSSKAFGTQKVANDRVTWFRLAEFSSFKPVENDARTSSDILREIIGRHIPNSDGQLTAFRSINGVAGGSLSIQRAETPVQVLSLLRHKFERSTYRDVVGDSEFDVYLRRKAEEWAKKRARG